MRTCLIVALITACTTDPGTIDGPLDYRVSGGFDGNGDGTHVRVELDGNVDATTRETGMQTYQLDPISLDRLHDKIYSAGFDAIERDYSTCCDQFVCEIAVQVDGTTRTVLANRFDGDAPPGVKNLIDELEALARR